MKGKRLRSPEELERLREGILSERRAHEGRKRIVLCTGTGCRGAGALEVLEALREELKGRAGIETKATCCHGFCERGPLMVVEP